MRKFLLKVFFFFLILTCLDFVLGNTIDYLYKNAHGGVVKRDNLISDSIVTDVLLCGSSRCSHHYNPQIIEDSLGVTCYNIGEDGNGIILAYGRLLMIKERQLPKIIIYDFSPGFDLLVGNNKKYLSLLNCHYHRSGIKEIFHSIDKTERYKMMSKLYQYNSQFVDIVKDFVNQEKQPNYNGFRPLIGKMNHMKIKSQMVNDTIMVDSLKLKYLNQFIKIARKECKILFVISPIWYGMDTQTRQPIIDICKNNGIDLIDYSNSHDYVHNDEWFIDGTHLNSKGADKFTRELIADIKRYL